MMVSYRGEGEIPPKYSLNLNFLQVCYARLQESVIYLKFSPPKKESCMKYWLTFVYLLEMSMAFLSNTRFLPACSPPCGLLIVILQNASYAIELIDEG